MLAVWVYSSAQDCVRAERQLAALAAAEPISVDDSLVVAWPVDRPGPAKRGLYGVAIRAALDDVLWGMLIGIAAYGRLTGTPATALGLADVLLERIGFGQDFVTALRAALAPGTWTVLMLGDTDTVRRIDTVLTVSARHTLHTEPGGLVAVTSTRKEF